MTDAEVQQAIQALAQLGAAAGNTRGGIAAVGQSMARLRGEMQRGTGTIQQNTQELRKLMTDFDNLDKAARSSAAGQSMLAEQTRMAGDIMRNAAGQMSGALLKGGIIEAVDYFRSQFFTSIKSFQDNVSGTEAVFRGQNAAMQSQISVLDRLTAGATVAAETLAMIPNPAARFGAALAAGVAVASDFASGLSKDTAKGLQVLQTEVSQSVLSYQSMTKSGMAFESGISDARKGSQDLRLNLGELTKVVVNNKKEFVEFGGSVTGGYVRVRSVGEAFNKLEGQGLNLREQLYRVGYSYEEQVQGISDYISMQHRSGELGKKTSEQLAKESTSYLINLKAISAFTGEDVKTAQARAKAASEQLAVAAALAEQGPGATERFEAAVSNMEPAMAKAMQQMTATGGTIVDKNLNIMLSQSPTRQKILDQTLEDQADRSLTAAEITERYQQRVRDNADALAAESLAMGKSLGQVTLLTGGYAEVTQLAQNQLELARKGQNDMTGVVGTVTEQFTQLKKGGMDPLLDSSVKLDTAFRNQAAKYGEAVTGVLQNYMTQGAPEKGIPTMEQQQQKQFEDTLILLKGLGVLAEIPPAFKTLREESSRVTEGVAGVAASLKEVAGSLIEAAKTLGTAATSLSQIPRLASGGIVSQPTMALIGEGRGPEAVIPLGDGNSVNVAFKNPASMLENLTPKAQGADTANTEQTISGIFNSPNLMTSSLAELKNLISMDGQMSQSLMKQHTDKMDTLIAAVNGNEDYLKRIADNIA